MDGAIISVLLMAGTLLYLALPKAPPLGLGASVAGGQRESEEERAQLRIEVLKEGTGESLAQEQTLLMRYSGKFEDGTVFETNIEEGQPLRVVLGRDAVISGWELGLLGMKVGEERRLIIPPALAYGEEGIPGIIPPNATLIFDVQLVGTGEPLEPI